MKNINIMKRLDRDNMPSHIGIIMDGNGRWAQNKNLPRSFGHREGTKRVIDIVEACFELEIPSLSLYAFSTENWKRPTEEISKLMSLLIYYINTQLEKIKQNNIKINLLGDITPFPEKVKKEIYRALQDTRDNDKMILNIGLNYGGQDEIVQALQTIAFEVEKGLLHAKDINKSLFESYLYTNNQPPLDLLIRPSGELRVSNFMLYQLAYAEFYFSNILWPDFTKEELYKAILEYQNRNRRFGGL
ncbi:MAG: isoprenyl transferase [Tissierellia bacterium]|nr:isoprenyl transferase [Tissierellia bacterium]